MATMSVNGVTLHYEEQKLIISSEAPLYLAKEEVKNLQKPAAFAILFG